MFNFARLDNEFRVIRNSTFTPASKLATLYGVTERTIRSDIQSINRTLAGHGAEVVLKRKAGYYLDVTNAASFNAFWSAPNAGDEAGLDLTTANNRIRVVIKALFDSDDYIRHADIAQIALVGESTTQSYLRRIKTIFDRYDLECVTHRSRGVRAFGTEANKRACYFSEVIAAHGDDLLSGFSQEDHRLFCGLDLGRLECRVIRALSNEGVIAADVGLTNLVLSVALMVKRIREQHPIDAGWTLRIPDDCAETVVAVAQTLEDVTGTKLSESEREWLYLQLLTFTDLGSGTIDTSQLNLIIDRLLASVRDNYGFDFRDDYRLRTGLLEHLKSTFKSSGLSHERQNPLTSTIKRSFPLAFEISLVSTSEALSGMPRALNEGDISYIALHIGAAIERKRSRLLSKRRIIVVCDAGRAALAVLVARISTLFSDRLKELAAVSKQEFSQLSDEQKSRADLIIATTSHIECASPTITVDFRLLEEDVQAISHWLETASTLRGHQLDRYFAANSFFVVDKPTTKREMLELMCDQLVKAGLTDKNLLDLVLEREGLSNTSISERMAIPHPMRLCSRETRVAVAILRHPVSWRDGTSEGEGAHAGGDSESSRVQLVFLLSMKPQSASEISQLYDVLVQVAGDSDAQSELIQAQSFEEFMDALERVGA